jgi:hypothetical protein
MDTQCQIDPQKSPQNEVTHLRLYLTRQLYLVERTRSH